MRMRLSYVLQSLALTAIQATYAAPLTPSSSPYPVAIWHGLGDSYTNPGLTSLGDDIKAALGNNTYVHYVHTSEDSAADQKSTLFGNMNTLLHDVAEGLRDNPGLQDGFDAIGLSQGGVFWRGYVERYGSSPGYPRVRNLITLGSPYVLRPTLPVYEPLIPVGADTWASHHRHHAILQTSSARPHSGH
jgi:palmitoyl-protein thioesterase